MMTFFVSGLLHWNSNAGKATSNSLLATAPWAYERPVTSYKETNLHTDITTRPHVISIRFGARVQANLFGKTNCQDSHTFWPGVMARLLLFDVNLPTRDKALCG